MILPGCASDGNLSPPAHSQSDRGPVAKVLGRCRRRICATSACVSAWQSRTLGGHCYVLSSLFPTTRAKLCIESDLSARSVKQAQAYTFPCARSVANGPKECAGKGGGTKYLTLLSFGNGIWK